MNWVRNNRFLAGFLAVLLVVGGALTFLLITAQSHYAEVSDQYDTQVKELQRLQGLIPFPDNVNLAKYEEVRQDYQQKVTELQTKLASLDLPLDNPPLTPLSFQDRLRKVVDDTVGKAQTAGVALPEGFYLGFEQYRGTPPDAAATALLGQQLTGIADLVNLIILQHPEKINSLKRGLLPQEVGASATPAPTQPGRPAAPAAPPLVTKYPLDIGFTALPSSFRDTVNKVTAARELYVIRALQVKNQVDKGPPRVEGATPGSPAAPAPGPVPGGVDANGVLNPPLPDKGPPPLRYVVGQERLDVLARIELASVLPPAPAPGPAR